MKYYVGIDMGTSSLKITLVNEAGHIHGQYSREYDYDMPHEDWREIKPAVWEEALDSCMKKLRRSKGDGIMQQIVGIGITGQMHTTVFLDKAGKSIRPAIMWNDNRAGVLLQDIKKRLPDKGSLGLIKGIISSGSPALNLAWLRKHEPENFQRLDKFIIGPDYLVYWLTGHLGTDYCEASTSSLYDLHNICWSEEMCEIIGVSPQQCPQICASSTIAGQLKEVLAKAWGMSNKIYVVVGTGDNAAATVATGADQGKFALMSLGTSGVLAFRRKGFIEAKGKNILFAADDSRPEFFVQGVLQSCGRTMNWWIKRILGIDDVSSAFVGIDWHDSARKKLLFYPHIMGEKTIYSNPDLRGAFIGLSESHTRQDILVAIMEGMAFGTKELVEKMSVPTDLMNPIRFTGGGSANTLWLRIMATVLNVPVQRIQNGGGAGYGAALLAMDKRPSIIDETNEIIYPEENLLACYLEKYNNYLRIHQAIGEILR